MSPAWLPVDQRELRGQAPEDEQALRIFELRADGEFPHLAHVRAARAYLQALPLGAALDRYCERLRAFTRAKGAEAKYHQTVTVALLLLIHSRLNEAPDGETFEQFLARAPELGTASCLQRFYSAQTLASDAARASFTFPDAAGTR